MIDMSSQASVLTTNLDTNLQLWLQGGSRKDSPSLEWAQPQQRARFNIWKEKKKKTCAFETGFSLSLPLCLINGDSLGSV